MPTRKGTKKGTKKASAKGASQSRSAKLPIKVQPLYGRPIDDAIRRGDPAEMRKLATQARQYIKEVQSALTSLERKIGR
jgi:MinD-like ATPase involved in chromosome partitioning or flagellar assembly